MTVRRANRLPVEELAPFLLEPPDAPAFLNWQVIFGNCHPVEVEVGFGKGLFLLTAAQACPAVNFLGIEILRKYQLYTATRLAKRGLGNVRLVKADARDFLRDRVGAASLQAIHVYFPDPWWKKRHLKRRVFTADFAANCQRALHPGGRLYIVSDVEDYFSLITELIQLNSRLRFLPPAEVKQPTHDLDYLTNFERKYRKEGRAVYRGVYEKA
jgi:tRNA (guanine-N7-)-methyltransferase